MNHLPGIGVFFQRYLSLWCQRLPLIVTGVLYKNILNSVEDTFGLFNSKDEHGGNCQNGDVASIFEDLLYQIMFDLHGKNMEGGRPFYGSY